MNMQFASTQASNYCPCIKLVQLVTNVIKCSNNLNLNFIVCVEAFGRGSKHAIQIKLVFLSMTLYDFLKYLQTDDKTTPAMPLRNANRMNSVLAVFLWRIVVQYNYMRCGRMLRAICILFLFYKVDHDFQHLNISAWRIQIKYCKHVME